MGPISAGMVSQAMAETSSLRGVVRTRTMRASGDIMAPPTPWKNRAAMKAGSEFEAAQAMEPAMKMPSAIWKILRAPNRSAIHPVSGMKIASANRYDVSASFNAIGSLWISEAIEASEVAITVESMVSMNSATARTRGTIGGALRFLTPVVLVAVELIPWPSPGGDGLRLPHPHRAASGRR